MLKVASRNSDFMIDTNLLIKEGEGLTVEFKERYSSKIVQDIVAFANAKGGKILLGVTDDGSIRGEKLTNAMKSEIVDLARNCQPAIQINVKQHGGVIVIDVPEGDEKPHMCSAGFFKRFDSITQKLAPKDVRNIFKSQASFHFDAKPLSGFTLADISLDKVREFLKETDTHIKVSKKTLADLLDSLKLRQEGKLTHAAVMMFARDVGRFMIHCQMHLVAFKGTERVHIYDKKYVRDDLLTQFREAEAFVKKHLNERAEIRDMRRHDIYEIPLDAIREAIVNAIIHRDYSMSGTNIQIEVLADRVNVSSPGGLPEGLPRSMLGKKSVRRNELLADLFHRMDKSERIGSGIPRIAALLEKAGLKPAKFESTTFFDVIFERPEEYRTTKGEPKATVPQLPQNCPTTALEKISQTAQQLVALIQADSQITRNVMADKLGISLSGVKYHLSHLQKKGVILHVGPTKRGHWEVKQTPVALKKHYSYNRKKQRAK
ncbi:MAG: hypothetical protein A2583_03010 [Bdellovibrionales bacterium RIFOXYD1_FULL_53_11]|nr:MAG: hypothetical protein A2583_03010 [Bdellovibrionales bacterium RIFOXYD1_FULL_53_11]